MSLFVTAPFSFLALSHLPSSVSFFMIDHDSSIAGQICCAFHGMVVILREVPESIARFSNNLFSYHR